MLLHFLALGKQEIVDLKRPKQPCPGLRLLSAVRLWYNEVAIPDDEVAWLN